MTKRALRYIRVALLAEIVGILSLYGSVALSGRLFAGENQFWTRACLPEHMISSPHLNEYGRLKTAGVYLLVHLDALDHAAPFVIGFPLAAVLATWIYDRRGKRA